MYKKCLKGKSMCTASSDHRPRQRVWFCLRKFTLLKILLYYPFINWKNDLQKRRKMKIHQTGKEFFTKAPVFFKKAKIIQKPTTSQPGEPGDVLPIRGSLIFLIITFASSISALNHNCSDFTNIPAGALSLMETWSIFSLILRNNGWFIHPFQSSGITIEKTILESLAVASVANWEEGLELLWIIWNTSRIISFIIIITSRCWFCFPKNCHSHH